VSGQVQRDRLCGRAVIVRDSEVIREIRFHRRREDDDQGAARRFFHGTVRSTIPSRPGEWAVLVSKGASNGVAARFRAVVPPEFEIVNVFSRLSPGFTIRSPPPTGFVTL